MKNLGFLAFVFGLATLLLVIMPASSPRQITRGKSRGVAACVPAGCVRTLHVWEESPATFPQIATFHEYSILGSSHVGRNNCKALRRNAGRNTPARCRCSLPNPLDTHPVQPNDKTLNTAIQPRRSPIPAFSD